MTINHNAGYRLALAGALNPGLVMVRLKSAILYDLGDHLPPRSPDVVISSAHRE